MQFKQRQLTLDQPSVMGILNVTPDSFSDGGKYASLDSALFQAEQMLSEGAAILDIGGESTRPGAADVSLEQELARVIPVIEAIHSRFDTIISIDTSKAEVMRQAVEAGAGLINDVRALQAPNALRVAAESGAAVCLMHMQGQPRSMQQSPEYDDLLGDISAFLSQRAQACIQAGIDENKILLDPGFGFGKTLEHNYQLLSHLQILAEIGYPLLVGLSRKSMLGKLLDRELDERLAGSLAAATICALKGAKIIRVHDVKQTVDAMKIVSKINSY